jgi:hypothetical protein
LRVDDFVKARYAPFYAMTRDRPRLTAGTDLRLLLISYFEAFDADGGIAWRSGDSLALRGFFGAGFVPSEHSTNSRTWRLIHQETRRAIFRWILQVLETAGRIKTGRDRWYRVRGERGPADIARRGSGETCQEFLTGPAQASSADTPTRTDLGRLNPTRPRRGRNTDGRHLHDSDARITKMNDSRTRLAHNAEHAADIEAGGIAGVTVDGAGQADTTTIRETVTTAAGELEAGAGATDGESAMIDETVADKGYHRDRVLVGLAALGLRTCIAEPHRGRRQWKPKVIARDAVYGNRRRTRGGHA